MAKLYFYYATMNSGKSKKLLQDNLDIANKGLETILLAPFNDGDDQSNIFISSRNGMRAPANGFGNTTDLFEKINALIKAANGSVDSVFIDEAQFLTPAQVRQLCKVVDCLELSVNCFGLRTTYTGKGFEGSKELLCFADEIISIKSVCSCGNLNSMHVRKDSKGNIVRTEIPEGILNKENYSSVCRKCYFQGGY